MVNEAVCEVFSLRALSRVRRSALLAARQRLTADTSSLYLESYGAICCLFSYGASILSLAFFVQDDSSHFGDGPNCSSAWSHNRANLLVAIEHTVIGGGD